MKNKKSICVISIVSLLLILCIVIGVSVKKSSKAEVKTGDSIVTIASYEDSSSGDSLSTYLGYGYNVAKKGYIHEKNVNDSAVDNMIFNMQESSGDAKNIRDTNIKVNNGSRTLDKDYIDGRSVENYLEQFDASITDKKISLPDGVTNWVPFMKDVYVEVGAKFKKTNTTMSKTAYVKDTMTKRSASITWMLEEKEYYDYLSENFKEDLMELDPEELFDRYGSHFFRSVILGGKLEYSAKITASTEKDLNTASAAFKINTSNEADKIETQTVNDNSKKKNNKNNNNSEDKDSIEYINNSKISDVTIDCSAYCYGGDANSYSDSFSTLAKEIATTTVADLSGENTDNQPDIDVDNVGLNSYDSWLNTVDKYPALIDIRDKYSLYAIWDLLDYFPENDPTISEEDAAKRKKELQEAFNNIGLENYNSIVSKYVDETSDSLYTEIETKLEGYNDYSDYYSNIPLKEDEAKIHSDYKLGNVFITNAGKTSDGKHILNEYSFDISYKLEQDPTKLPVGDTKYTEHYLTSDWTHVSKVVGYGDIFSFWKQFAPRKGGYYVQVIYKNNNSTSFAENNLLKGKNNGDATIMYTSNPTEIEMNGGVAEIKVLFIYRTESAKNGFLPKAYKWIQQGSIKFE